MPTVVFIAHQQGHSVSDLEDTEPNSGQLAGARGRYLRPMKGFVSLILAVLVWMRGVA